MALQKLIEDNKGIECRYHRISKIMLDVDNKCILATIKSYKNKEMRDKEKRYYELQLLISDKEKAITLQEIDNSDAEYIAYKQEIETLVPSTVIEIKEYRLEVSVTVDMQVNITNVYNLLKQNHGIFIESTDI